MERKIRFAPGEFYHLYNRGVEKRKIFLSEDDYSRFLLLLYILNQDKQIVISNLLKSNKKYSDIYNIDLQNGDKVNFIVGDCGQVNFIPVTKNVTTLKGIIPKPEKAVSIEDMKNTIRTKGSQS